jgi:hypothetical protein
MSSANQLSNHKNLPKIPHLEGLSDTDMLDALDAWLTELHTLKSSGAHDATCCDDPNIASDTYDVFDFENQLETDHIRSMIRTYEAGHVMPYLQEAYLDRILELIYLKAEDLYSKEALPHWDDVVRYGACPDKHAHMSNEEIRKWYAHRYKGALAHTPLDALQHPQGDLWEDNPNTAYFSRTLCNLLHPDTFDPGDFFIRTDIPIVYLNALLMGAEIPDLITIEELCKYFKVSPIVFFDPALLDFIEELQKEAG